MSDADFIASNREIAGIEHLVTLDGGNVVTWHDQSENDYDLGLLEEATERQPTRIDTTPYTGPLDPDLDPDLYEEDLLGRRFTKLEQRVEEIFKMLEEMNSVKKIENMKL